MIYLAYKTLGYREGEMGPTQCHKAYLQYLIAIVSIVALVALNIWGVKDSQSLETMLFSVISATVWGGMQREQGVYDERKRVKDGG